MQTIINQLKQLNLNAMAEALTTQPTNHNFSFEERLGLLLDYEITKKNTRKITRLFKEAKLKQSLILEEIGWQQTSGLSREQYLSLLRLDFIKQRSNIIITGATGTGKTYLANAIGNKACREGYRVQFIKMAYLLDNLTINHKTSNLYRYLQHLLKYDLLIFDDFGLSAIENQQLHDLITIIDERFELKSTIITSQLPITTWHNYLNEPTLADALLDRLLSKAEKIELIGESLRWEKNKISSKNLDKEAI